MSSTQESFAVSAVQVGDAERIDFLPAFFGPRLMIYGETLVFKWLERLSADYKGGLWNFHKLSNGGFYMAPEAPQRLCLVCTGNHFDGELSADAAGVVATLFALGQLAATENGEDQERFVDRFYELREFASDHPEAGLIFQAID